MVRYPTQLVQSTLSLRYERLLDQIEHHESRKRTLFVHQTLSTWKLPHTMYRQYRPCHRLKIKKNHNHIADHNNFSMFLSPMITSHPSTDPTKSIRSISFAFALCLMIIARLQSTSCFFNKASLNFFALGNSKY